MRAVVTEAPDTTMLMVEANAGAGAAVRTGEHLLSAFLLGVTGVARSIPLPAPVRVSARELAS
ncbi:hypothetical protein [Nonomuraea sp. KM90]|uniref:hypothetical protein n=1 Tax=Nonomuraea sp. KM90 TaxID=3457428 RepID=UPI003FCC62E4